MSVMYKLVEHHSNLPGIPEYRIVTIDFQTVGLDHIGQRIQNDTALTRADVIGAIAALRDVMAEELMKGSCIHLPGIGYFSIAATGDIYEDPRSHHRRLRNASVRTVRFRPDAEMMWTLRNTHFENMTYRFGRTSVPTAAAIDAAVDKLTADRRPFTVEDLRRQLGLSRTNAYRIATRLETEGKIHNVGTPRRKLYERQDG